MRDFFRIHYHHKLKSSFPYFSYDTFHLCLITQVIRVTVSYLLLKIFMNMIYLKEVLKSTGFVKPRYLIDLASNILDFGMRISIIW